MNLEMEAHEGELKKLRRMFKMIKHIDLAEKLGDIYFIAGEIGEKDKNGLPETLLICPAYGVDWVQLYKRADDIIGPEW